MTPPFLKYTPGETNIFLNGRSVTKLAPAGTHIAVATIHNGIEIITKKAKNSIDHW